jgi:glyoxylase I family protein
MSAQSSQGAEQNFIAGLWAVRYQVKDVNRSIAFYTQQLGFKLDQQNLPAFAQVSTRGLKLILSGPARPAPGQCRMAGSKNQEAGIVWCFRCRIFPHTLTR